MMSADGTQGTLPDVESEAAQLRPVCAEVDLAAVAANVRLLKEIIGPNCAVMAVVKANGYGLGAPEMAGAALKGGASRLAVAFVSEGVQLRQAGFEAPILVMSYVPPEEAELVVRNRLTPALHRSRTAQALEKAAAELGLGPGAVAVHVKVDTGLGRYGCTPEELLPLVRSIQAMPHLHLQGLMTHLADADNPDQTFARRQLGLFNKVRQQVEGEGIRFELVHAANSAAALALPEARFDMVRCGILLSGNAVSGQDSGFAWQPVFSLRSSLVRVHTAEPGSTVGYGRTWTASWPALIGLVPLGYADGYRRALSNRAEALVRGRRCPVVGRVSMDQITLDLSGVPDAMEGDEVVLVGSQGGETISAAEWAGWADTISYEMLCGLTERVPRIYRGGK